MSFFPTLQDILNMFDSYMCYFFLDEGALVKGAKELGFFFKTRTPNTVTVEVVSNPHKHHMSLLFLLLYNDKLDWHVQ